MNLQRMADPIGHGAGTYIVETDMNAAIARLLPRASATLVADLDALISTSMFCGIGLLLSLSVLILDRHIPGDWF
jgi:hypothetical protein